MLGLAYPLFIDRHRAGRCSPARPTARRSSEDGKVVGSKLIAPGLPRPVLDANGKPKDDADGNPVLAPDPRYFQPRPSQTGYSRHASASSPTSAPTSKDARDLYQGSRRRYLALERPFTPGLTARRRSRSTP